jgi:hypothetical protein
VANQETRPAPDGPRATLGSDAPTAADSVRSADQASPGAARSRSRTVLCDEASAPAVQTTATRPPAPDTFGESACSPGADSAAGGPQAPPAGRSLAETAAGEPGSAAWLHAATKPPAPSPPNATPSELASCEDTCSPGPNAATAAGRTAAYSVTAPGGPGADTVQSTPAAPVWSTVSSTRAPAPGPERSTGALHADDPAARVAARTTPPAPVCATQAIVATPSGPIATRALEAGSPAGVRS